MHERLSEPVRKRKDPTDKNQYSKKRWNKGKDTDHSRSEIPYEPENYQECTECEGLDSHDV